MTVQDLTRRVAKLERAMAEMSNVTPARNGAWYLANAGKFANDPIYSEITNRGRAYRRSLRPKAPRKSSRKKH